VHRNAEDAEATTVSVNRQIDDAWITTLLSRLELISPQSRAGLAWGACSGHSRRDSSTSANSAFAEGCGERTVGAKEGVAHVLHCCHLLCLYGCALGLFAQLWFFMR